MTDRKSRVNGLLAGNDVLEIWDVNDERYAGGHVATHADRASQDQRAKIVFDLIRSWQYSQMGYAMADAMAHEHQPHKREKLRASAREEILKIIEVVDIAWTELQIRGWIVSIPTMYPDALEPAEDANR